VTTERRSRRIKTAIACMGLVAVLTVPASCATESVGKSMGLGKDQVEKLPPNVADSYDVFAYKCSRCHSLSRPLNAQIYDLSHWREYVARMRKHAGSAISEADGEKILVFLAYWAEQKARQRAEREGIEAKTSPPAPATPPRAEPPPAPPPLAPPPPEGEHGDGGLAE
jgi:hypothetical protein